MLLSGFGLKRVLLGSFGSPFEGLRAKTIFTNSRSTAIAPSLARIAFGGVAEQALRLPALEQALQGQIITDSLMADLHEQVRASLNPISDVRASRDYRREMAANLIVRALKEALGTPMPQIYGLDDYA